MLPWHLPKLGNSHKMLLRTNQLSRRRDLCPRVGPHEVVEMEQIIAAFRL